MTLFPETRESLIVQVKDPSNRDAWGQFVDIYRPLIHRIAVSRRPPDQPARSSSIQDRLVECPGRNDETDSLITLEYRRELKRLRMAIAEIEESQQ